MAVNETIMEKVRVLLDDASQDSFVTENFRKKLGWPKSTTSAVTINGMCDLECGTSRYYTTVALRTNDNRIFKFQAYILPRITGVIAKTPSKNVQELIKKTEVKYEIKFDSMNLPIDIMIGTQLLQAVQTGKLIRLSKSLSMIETIFGPCLTGGEKPVWTFCHVTCQDVDVTKLWKSEELEANSDCNLAEELINKITNTIELKEGRYWIGLPWLHDQNLESNFGLCVKRLRLLVKQLTNKNQYEMYESELFKLMNDGFAEQIYENETNNGYYMPHHPVIKNDRKTTKLRIVFDMSSHQRDSASLNELLSKGINLNPLLVEMLIKFRVGAHAILADINQAFLQIIISVIVMNSYL
jgi:hypothetical protein